METPAETEADTIPRPIALVLSSHHLVFCQVAGPWELNSNRRYQHEPPPDPHPLHDTSHRAIAQRGAGRSVLGQPYQQSGLDKILASSEPWHR